MNLTQRSATYFKVNDAHDIEHSSVPVCLSSISNYSHFLDLYLLTLKALP